MSTTRTKKNIKYWAIEFDQKTNEKIKQYLNIWANDFSHWTKFVWQSSFHITLYYNPTPEINEKFQPFIDKEINLTLEQVASTLLIAAIKVNKISVIEQIPNLPLTQKHLHITLGMFPGIRPIMANSLWDYYKNDIVVKDLKNFEISGKIRPIGSRICS